MNITTEPAEGAVPDDGHSYRMPMRRLRLMPGVSHGPLDGAWWPLCDALELELPALVGSLDPGIGTVTRVTVETAAWPDAPQEVMAPGHVIEVVLTDSAAEAHAITVDCGTVGSWELLVIPPPPPGRAGPSGHPVADRCFRPREPTVGSAPAGTRRERPRRTGRTGVGRRSRTQVSSPADSA
ncbi:DUF5994 family protein [Streptomyces sp. NPDC017966]|uniref:DUF5994 family protein n=1 Tax=Streptomyces sp. NPDC017966 TaxID=3365023 RepID=UPI0037B3EED3